jgi:hypothetical protein
VQTVQDVTIMAMVGAFLELEPEFKEIAERYVDVHETAA